MRLGRIVAGLALAAILAACGSSRPAPASDTKYTGDPPPTVGEDGDESTKPPGCGTAPDGAQCGCVDVPLFVDPPNMYFVLDHSGSMEAGGKWDQVRITVGRLLRDIGPRANFAATIFPAPNTGDACGTGTEIMSLRGGDPPSTKDGPTTRFLLSATSTAPTGGTPTAATLREVLNRVRGYTGKTFVILATDGGPNCNAQTTCTPATCIDNIENIPGCPTGGPGNCCEGVRADSCLDELPTNTAVRALAQSGFPVYVVGIPGSGPYAGLLDGLATAGGTAQPTSPKYYRVDSAGSNELLGTLRKVAAKIVATCTFKLKEAPQDPGLVNVYLDEIVLPRDPANGWTIAGDTVTLVGNACTKVTNGDVLGVRIIAGCPSVIN